MNNYVQTDNIRKVQLDLLINSGCSSSPCVIPPCLSRYRFRSSGFIYRWRDLIFRFAVRHIYQWSLSEQNIHDFKPINGGFFSDFQVCSASGTRVCRRRLRRGSSICKKGMSVCKGCCEMRWTPQKSAMPYGKVADVAVKSCFYLPATHKKRLLMVFPLYCPGTISTTLTRTDKH